MQKTKLHSKKPAVRKNNVTIDNTILKTTTSVGGKKEVGSYYAIARCLNLHTFRWMSTDSELGEYIPGALINDEVRRQNQSQSGSEMIKIRSEGDLSFTTNRPGFVASVSYNKSCIDDL